MSSADPNTNPVDNSTDKANLSVDATGETQATATADDAAGSSNEKRRASDAGAALGGDNIKIFSSSRPRDALDGTAKGLGNVAKGVLGGVAMMVAAPIQGGIEGGRTGGATGAAKGAALGLGLGIVGGTCTAVYGVGAGIMQIGRGLWNTKDAVIAKNAGADWDDEDKDWKFFDLERDSKKILGQTEEEYTQELRDQEAAMRQAMQEASGAPGTSVNPSAAEASAKKSAIKVKDTELYDLLGVEASASTSEIKKAYYVAAKKSHPDKHPNDPEANSRFQRIGEAYQILSDETLRKNYDLGGRDGVKDGEEMRIDPSMLFAMLFGSEDFDPIVGELSVATQMRLGMSAQEGEANDENPMGALGDQKNEGYGSNFNSKLLKFVQKQREMKCALALAQKLQTYLDLFPDEADSIGSPAAQEQQRKERDEKFRKVIEAEAQSLAANPIGKVLLATVGNAYLEWYRSETGTMESIAVGMKQTRRNIYTKASITYATIKSLYGGMELNKMVNVKDEKQEDATSAEAKPAEDTTGADKPGASTADPKGKAAKDEENMKASLAKTVGSMAIILWRVTELDIRSTMSKVCRRVTHDHSVPELTRNRRLAGLRVIGEAYSAHMPEHVSSYGASAEEVLTLLAPIMEPMQQAAQNKAEEGCGVNTEGVKVDEN